MLSDVPIEDCLKSTLAADNHSPFQKEQSETMTIQTMKRKGGDVLNEPLRDEDLPSLLPL